MHVVTRVPVEKKVRDCSTCVQVPQNKIHNSTNFRKLQWKLHLKIKSDN